MHTLHPVPEPIALFNEYILSQETSQTILLREKVLSATGDSFDIKLLNTNTATNASTSNAGQPLLTVHGAWMSLSGRKKVSDAKTGHRLFDIVKEHLHFLHSTFAVDLPGYLGSVGGRRLVEVKSNLTLFGSKATASFTSTTGKTQTFTIKGDWFDRNADIVDEHSGHAVARINRKLLNGRELLFGQQTYAVEVAPGVDVALIAALCICFDEKNNEEGS